MASEIARLLNTNSDKIKLQELLNNYPDNEDLISENKNSDDTDCLHETTSDNAKESNSDEEFDITNRW